MEVVASTTDTTTATDDAATGPGDSYDGMCQETITVLTSSDAVGPTGISPATVLAEAQGIYTGTMTWTAEGPVRYTGALGPTATEVEVTYAGGEIRDVVAELVMPCQHDGPCPCEDRLEVDVQIRLVTADGALDEVWTATLNHLPPTEDIYFGSPGTSIYHRFDPDDTQGALSRASFAVSDGVVINEMVATAQLSRGALEGSLNVEVAMPDGADGGWIGFGSIAGFGAITSLEACTELSEYACAAASCTLVSGSPVYSGVAGCDCSPAQNYCFAGELIGEAVPTLYTRERAGYHEVVSFSTLVETPAEPWRLCSAAPEVEECSCFGGMGECP
jgi:hypothetical protein